MVNVRLRKSGLPMIAATMGITTLLTSELTTAANARPMTNATASSMMLPSVLLVDSLPYLSAEAILLAIVDPSVGRDRDVALESNDGRLLVGPDNGILL